MSAVTFEHVTRRYGDITALDDVTFTVPSGSIYGVVGTSGAGKSTLLRTVNGLETPSRAPSPCSTVTRPGSGSPVCDPCVGRSR